MTFLKDTPREAGWVERQHIDSMEWFRRDGPAGVVVSGAGNPMSYAVLDYFVNNPPAQLAGPFNNLAAAKVAYLLHISKR